MAGAVIGVVCRRCRTGCPCADGRAGGDGCRRDYIAGVTAPQYGMPMCGTPIGLPGPPHVPLGVPAGLQKHTIVNHTRVHMPEPDAITCAIDVPAAGIGPAAHELSRRAGQCPRAAIVDEHAEARRSHGSASRAAAR